MMADNEFDNYPSCLQDDDMTAKQSCCYCYECSQVLICLYQLPHTLPPTRISAIKQ